jgi:hypothetical protein
MFTALLLRAKIMAYVHFKPLEYLKHPKVQNSHQRGLYTKKFRF